MGVVMWEDSIQQDLLRRGMYLGVDASDPAARRAAVKEKTIAPCAHPGCDRLAMGPRAALCRPHYLQRWKERAGPCTVEGCSGLIHARGVCHMHYKRLMKRGHA